MENNKEIQAIIFHFIFKRLVVTEKRRASYRILWYARRRLPTMNVAMEVKARQTQEKFDRVSQSTSSFLLPFRLLQKSKTNVVFLLCFLA